jgi:hypothetical protein
MRFVDIGLQFDNNAPPYSGRIDYLKDLQENYVKRYKYKTKNSVEQGLNRAWNQ